MTFDNPYGEPTTPPAQQQYVAPTAAVYPPQPPPYGYLPPAPAPEPRRSRRGLIAVIAGVTVLGVGGIAAAAVLFGGASKKLSQGEICDQVKKGGDLVARSTPNAAIAVSAGGTAPADVPALPVGQKAVCTMKVTVASVTVPIYVAVYDKNTKFDTYKSTLQSRGYTLADPSVAPKSSGVTGMFSDAKGHMSLLIDIDGFAAVELLTVPDLPGAN